MSHLAWWLFRCRAIRPPAYYESPDAPYLYCARHRGHLGKHRTAFGLEWL